MLTLYYTALSPFCRKVRMAMEYKGIAFEIVHADNVHEMKAFNPRAEFPMLTDGDLVVCNSPDILGYVDRKFPARPVYPADAANYAEVRELERMADTHLDAIVTVIGNWAFAELPPMPQGLHDVAKRDAALVYDQLEARLKNRDYLAGEISAADFAFYPHVSAGAALNLPLDPARHGKLRDWMKSMRNRPEGQTDLAAAREWWANKDKKTTDTKRINWGTFRLEWLLANGQADWFADQVRQGKVLWSVGPDNNAKNIPVAPDWARTAASH